jgi:hypothetical protein
MRRATCQMELAAMTFAITNREGDLFALAALCSSARYCSIRRPSEPRTERIFVAAKEWAGVERQLASGLPTQPRPPESPIASVFQQPPEARTVQWLGATPITIERPDDAVRALDQHLRASLQAYRPGLRLEQTKKGRE